MPTTLRPLRILEIQEAALPRAGAFQREEEYLAWLWRYRVSDDGEHAWCATCRLRRRFHRSSTRPSYTCDSCGRHVHPTAGSIMHGSSTPLSIWFEAIRLMRFSEGPTPTARELERLLGIPYATARRIRARILGELAGPRAAVPGANTATGPQERGEGTRERVLEVASRLIAEKGYDSVRVQDIAERAEVSPAAVLYHFDSRAKVLVAALGWATTRASRRRDEVLEQISDPALRLAALLALLMPSTEVVRTEVLIWNEYFARAARGELSGADDAPVFRYRAVFRQIIEEGGEARAFVFAETDADATEIIEEFLALLDGIAIAMLVERPWMSAERAVRIVSRFVRRELSCDIEQALEERLTRANDLQNR